MKPCRILVIDDHTLFRTGLSMILKQDDRVSEVCEAGSVGEALALEQETMNLILLDIQLPGRSGLDGLADLRARFANTPIIMLSASHEPWELRRAAQQGAAGFLSKAAPADEILEAMDRALRGKPVLSIGNNGGDGCLNNQNLVADSPNGLTERQREVLHQLCKGKSNKLIARELGMAENTVRVHVSAILSHLSAANRAEAIVAAQRQGLLDNH